MARRVGKNPEVQLVSPCGGPGKQTENKKCPWGAT